jgi:hypothetical protein
MSERNFVAIGSGIQGNAVIRKAVESGYFASVNVVALEKNPLIEQLESRINYYIVDKRNKIEFQSVLSEINKSRSLVCFDTTSYEAKESLRVLKTLSNLEQYIYTSTALVYDPRQNTRIDGIVDETCLRWNNPKDCGTYVWNKIMLENSMQKYAIDNPAKKIRGLREFHVLGEGAYLGCVSPVCRDPKLEEKLRSLKLDLALGGSQYYSLVDVLDIANINQKMIQENWESGFYNIVNPTHFQAKSYYQIIANEIGLDGFKIEALTPAEAVRQGRWKFLAGTQHIYESIKIKPEEFLIEPEESIRRVTRYYLNHPEIHDIPINKIPVHQNMNKGIAPGFSIKEIVMLRTHPNNIADFHFESGIISD